MIRLVLAASLLALTACVIPPPQDSLPDLSTYSPPTPQPDLPSNSEIARDFLNLHFATETGTQLAHFTRFEDPIRLSLSGDIPATAPQDLQEVLRLLRAQGIDIATTRGRGNLRLTFLPRADLRAEMANAACFVIPAPLDWQGFRAARGTDALDWARLQTRTGASIFLPADAPPQDIRDCLHEEIAQAIGPLNDLYHLPNSVFNDDNIHGQLTDFDRLILRISYDPALRSGMTADEVTAALPALLDRVNPKGGATNPLPAVDTPRAYVQAVEQALGAAPSGAARQEAARRALTLASDADWHDNRRALAHLLLGRLLPPDRAAEALGHFQAAATLFAPLPAGQLRQAHVDVQVAGMALAFGRPELALEIATRATVAARAAQDATLLATLAMMRATALTELGNPAQANRAYLDSQYWAGYAFGPMTDPEEERP